MLKEGGAVRQRAKRADPERATRAKCASPDREAANTEALCIQAYIGERAKRASPNPRAKRAQEAREPQPAMRGWVLSLISSIAPISTIRSHAPSLVVYSCIEYYQSTDWRWYH